MGTMLMTKNDEDEGDGGDDDGADPSNDRRSSGESLRVVPVTAEGGGGECVQERAVKPEE